MENYVSSLSTRQRNLLEAVQKQTFADVKKSLHRFPLIKDTTFSHLLLVAALHRRHKSISLLLMSKKCSVHSSFKTHHYFTPMYYAIKQGDIRMFKALHQKGAAICGRDANSETPLELAVLDQNSQFWEFIVSKLDYNSLDPNSKEHVAIFHAACYKGNLEVVKQFVERNFSVNSRSDSLQGKWAGATPLQFALKGHKNTHEIIKYLLTLDVDFNIQDEQGETPILSTVTIDVDPFDIDNGFVNDIFEAYVRHFEYGNNPVNKHGLSHFHLLCTLNWTHDDCLLKKEAQKHLDILEFFIENGVEVNSANRLRSNDDDGNAYYAGYTALHWAAQKSSPTVIELLLKNGADPLKIDAQGRTPLHLLKFRNPESVVMAELLVEYGADVDVKDAHGYTSMQHAFHLEKRNEPLMQLLWSKSKQTVDYIDPSGLSYLHIASTRDLGRVKTLLKNGASIKSRLNTQEKRLRGYTALHFAASFNKVEIVKYLLAHGAVVNPGIGTMDSPLHLACTEQLKYFYGVDYDNHSHYLETMGPNAIPPIHQADEWAKSRKDQMLIIELLLEHGSSITVENFRGDRPLAAACELPTFVFQVAVCYTSEYQNRIYEEIAIRRKMIIDILLRFGANINSEVPCTRAILFKLFLGSYKSRMERDVADLLLERGADVDAKDHGGLTLLHFAFVNLIGEVEGERFSHDSSFIDLFLKFGANVNSKSENGDSILHSSVRYYTSDRDYHMAFVKLLDQPDIYLDVQDKNGNTPLHIAVHLRKLFCVQKLLDAGADINVRNTNGDSPARALYKFVKKINYIVDNNDLHICKATIEHLKKLVKLEYFVSRENLSCLKSLSIVDCGAATDSAIDDEVMKLKSSKVDNYTSLHRILMKDSNDVTGHVKNKVFEEIVSSSQLESNFPIFCHFLTRQYKKGLSRSLILEPAKKALRIVTRIEWTDSCSERILRHLSSDDLKNLTKCRLVNISRKRSSEDLIVVGKRGTKILRHR